MQDVQDAQDEVYAHVWTRRLRLLMVWGQATASSRRARRARNPHWRMASECPCSRR